jgi:hypothetical protein
MCSKTYVAGRARGAVVFYSRRRRNHRFQSPNHRGCGAESRVLRPASQRPCAASRVNDPKLDAAGWRLCGRQAHGSEEVDTANGPADYAPWLDDRIVGVVEAKKVTVAAQNVLT